MRFLLGAIGALLFAVVAGGCLYRYSISKHRATLIGGCTLLLAAVALGCFANPPTASLNGWPLWSQWSLSVLLGVVAITGFVFHAKTDKTQYIWLGYCFLLAAYSSGCVAFLNQFWPSQ